MNRNTLSIRDTLTLQITVVSDDKEARDFSLSKFPTDFPFQVLRQAGPSRSTQSQVRFVNGHMESSSTVTSIYQFMLKPSTTGTLQIPALEVTYGNTVLKTTPIRIIVADSKQAVAATAVQSSEPQVEFRQYLSLEETVMGAPVALTYELLIPATLDIENIGPDYRLEALESDFKTEGYDDPHWGQKVTVIDGVRYTIVNKVVRLTPKHPGKFEIPECIMTYEYRVPKQNDGRSRRRPDFFGDDFFDDFPFFGRGGQIKQDTIVAEPLTLTVEDFPSEGRPQDFSGLIGPIDATASVDLQEVYVGDPITLTIQLTGPSLDADSKLPDLKSVLEKDGKVRISGDDPITVDENGTLHYTRTIRVLSADVTELPALELPYYDLEKKSYSIARTNALPLTVQQVKQVTLEDAAIQRDPAIPLPLPEKPKTTLTATEGMLETADQDALLRRCWSPFSGDTPQSWLLLALFLVPLSIWGATAFGLHLRRKGSRISPAERAARKAKDVLRSALKGISEENAEDGRRLAAALRAFLGQRFGIAGAVTSNDLQDAMFQKGYTQEQIQTARSLLEQSDAIQYGGATLSVSELKARILETAEDL